MSKALHLFHRLAVVALVLAAALCLATFAPASPASADDLDDRRRAAERKKKQNEEELEKLSHELEEIGEELAEAVLALRRVELGDGRDDGIHDLDALRKRGDIVGGEIVQEDVLYDRAADRDAKALWKRK